MDFACGGTLDLAPAGALLRGVEQSMAACVSAFKFFVYSIALLVRSLVPRGRWRPSRRSCRLSVHDDAAHRCARRAADVFARALVRLWREYFAGGTDAA